LTSIKAISEALATALIETTNGFQAFPSAQALAHWLSAWSGKTGFSQGRSGVGDAHLPGLL